MDKLSLAQLAIILAVAGVFLFLIVLVIARRGGIRLSHGKTSLNFGQEETQYAIIRLLELQGTILNEIYFLENIEKISRQMNYAKTKIKAGLDSLFVIYKKERLQVCSTPLQVDPQSYHYRAITAYLELRLEKTAEDAFINNHLLQKEGREWHDYLEVQVEEICGMVSTILDGFYFTAEPPTRERLQTLNCEIKHILGREIMDTFEEARRIALKIDEEINEKRSYLSEEIQKIIPSENTVAVI